MDLRAVRDVNNGFGDGLAAAFEIVVTPLLFAFFGYLLDRWLGLHLVFALIFGLFTFGYMMFKLVKDYSAQMARHDADAPWARPAAPPAESNRAGPMFEPKMFEPVDQTHLEGSPELEIVGDMVRRALPVAPVLLLICGLIWGVDGALSSAYGLALVLLNFLIAAALLAWAARISPTMLMAATLGGFLPARA